ncbi:MAG: CaiB/BaiF CoA transferase family protein [Dehalococcoidia bacterium]
MEQSSGAMALPLEGIRVVDLTHYSAGPFCTRVLADYGADVIKVEPPEGDPARLLPPFYRDEPGLERSGTFLFLNTSKRSVVLDLKTAEGRGRLLRLVRTADAVVENFAPGTLSKLGLGYAELSAVNPRLVLTSITNFGQDGPWRDWQGTDLTLYAMGGPMIATGDASREPVRLAGRWASYHVGHLAALATTIALRAAELRGVGEHVDLSYFEAFTHSIEQRLSQMMAYQYTGRLATRAAHAANAGGVFPCADGWFFVGAGAGYFVSLVKMLGQEALLDTPRYADPDLTDPEFVEEVRTLILAWTLQRTRSEARAACQRFGVLGAPINTTADFMSDEHFLARNWFHEIDHPTTGPLRYPGYHFQIHDESGPMPPRRRAPLLGEHTEEVFAELDDAAPPPRATAPDRLGGRLPLDGVRVLDFTVVWAGPYATMHLADWGAEVIRIESRQHFAAITRMPTARPPTTYIGPTTAFPDEVLGARPWNRCALFTGHARGKKSMTLDLERQDGQEVFEQLVREADVLVENNLPSHMEGLGITWERLSKVNPRLVLVRVPAFGLTGPYSEYRTLGNNMESIAGHNVIRAYPDLALDYAPGGVPADALSGIAGALAATLGLRHRDRTGRGMYVESATTENMVPMLGEFIMDFSMNGRQWEGMANDHFFLAPHNVYRCAGQDNWVTIAVRHDEDWRALCALLQRPDLVDDPRFSTTAGRYEHRRALDATIGEWTLMRDADWIMRRLQAEGVPAGAVMHEPQVLDSPQHAARGFFQEIEGAEVGRYRYVGPAWRASRTPRATATPPPLLGEHNPHVYRDILGFTDEQYRQFEGLGHIGMDYELA